jgi:hypothetical protein
MSKSTPEGFRLTDDDRKRIKELGRIWGPVKPLNKAEVFREAIRRCYEAEGRQKTSRKSTAAS